VFALRLLTICRQRYDGLAPVLEADPELKIVVSADDLDQLTLDPDLGADVILVDLAYARTIEPRFWAELHVLFPGSRFVALIESSTDAAKIALALQCGANYMVDWAEPCNRLRRAARAAARCQGFIPLANALRATVDYFQHSTHTEPLLHFGDIYVDPSRHVLVNGSSEIPLTALEQQLLLYLADNAGRVVPMDELLRAVWNEPPEDMTGNYQIKSVVKRLRLKLEPEPTRPRYLLNRRGCGYFIPERAMR
jgi:DNA-binding response OmpR family regulator